MINMIEDFSFIKEKLLTVEEWHHLKAEDELKEAVQKKMKSKCYYLFE
jgi:hypothetical protein